MFYVMSSSVDDEEEEDQQNENQDENGADLAHVIGFEQFSKFALEVAHLFGSVIDRMVKLLDKMPLFGQFLVNNPPVSLESFSYCNDLVNDLVLLFYLLLWESLHQFSY